MFNLFKKKTPDIAGDARVPILLQSIAVGADPTTQVNAIRAITDKMKIAGDAKTTWDGYLEELASCKNEEAAAKAAAVDIVGKFYNEMVAGDTVGAPNDDPKGADVKPDPKAEAGDAPPDENGGKKPDGDGDKDDKKSAGDAIEERFSKIESSLDKLVVAVGQIVAGDAKPKEEKPAEEPGEARASMAGDSGSSEKKQSVSDFMSALRG
jgi:hypothetical protein